MRDGFLFTAGLLIAIVLVGQTTAPATQPTTQASPANAADLAPTIPAELYPKTTTEKKADALARVARVQRWSKENFEGKLIFAIGSKKSGMQIAVDSPNIRTKVEGNPTSVIVMVSGQGTGPLDKYKGGARLRVVGKCEAVGIQSGSKVSVVFIMSDATVTEEP